MRHISFHLQFSTSDLTCSGNSSEVLLSHHIFRGKTYTCLCEAKKKKKLLEFVATETLLENDGGAAMKTEIMMKCLKVGRFNQNSH